jgi:probable HAF family extracellular repeat protein
VGFFFDGARSHGFVYTRGRFVVIDVPGAVGTHAQGINDRGQIVGRFFDSAGEHGFLATPAAGVR